MKFFFVDRESYRNKQLLIKNYFENHNEKDYYIIPEGGTNQLAVKGTSEILNNETSIFDYICTSVGTGGTIAGLANSKENHQILLGFPVLKTSDFLIDEINKYTKNKFMLLTGYHFGGYAKKNEELIQFIKKFIVNTNITIEPIYTGKMFYGIYEEIKNNNMKDNSKILAIHTGGY